MTTPLPIPDTPRPAGRTADTLLDQAAAALVQGETCRTVNYLRCGQLLQEVLEMRCDRDGEKRSRVLNAAHTRLRQATGCAPNPHVLLLCHHIHRLLSDGIDPTEHRLPWSGYKVLMRLVSRTDRDDSQCNTWEVNPGVDADAARALFRCWAEAFPRLTLDELKVEVDRLFGHVRPQLLQDTHVPQRQAQKAKPSGSRPPGKNILDVPHLEPASLAEAICRSDDVEATLFDLAGAIDWELSHLEALAAGLAEAGDVNALSALHSACAAELSRLKGRRKIA